MKIRKRFRRIGITGSARSGKTVFLLSLISHLEAGDLKLNGAETRRFRRRDIKAGPLARLLGRLPGAGSFFRKERDEFDYLELRKYLADQKKWPGKTTDSFFFRCRFRRVLKGNKWKNYLWHPIASLSEDEIEFFDFPGERVADVTMIGKDFGSWSDTMIRDIRDPRKAPFAEKFLAEIESESPDQGKLIAYWKLAQGLLFDKKHALITPSTLLVDDEGNTDRDRVVALRDLKRTGSEINDESIRARLKVLRKNNQVKIGSIEVSPEEFAVACCAGLPGREFTPLPEAVRKSVPELARHFDEHYKLYQQQVVRPFAANLLDCHSLIFLIDLADVLACGPRKLNDTQEMIVQLLACIERSRGFFKELFRGIANKGRWIFGGKSKFIDRIAFVASKADRIRGRQTDEAKRLLEYAAGKFARNSGPSYTECHVCSACISTEPKPGEESILIGRPIWEFAEGRLQYRSPEAPECEVFVPTLPDHWPARDWDCEKFQFADFHPAIPHIDREPPPQRGLDAVLSFALELTTESLR
jgi:predicted YcjX-like family ATPase